LIDAKTPAPLDRKLPPAVLDAVAQYPPETGEPAPVELRRFMRTALLADLRESERGLFTRIVCARAAQLEIVRQELGPLVAQTQTDADLGAFTAPLDLSVSGDSSVMPAVE